MTESMVFIFLNADGTIKDGAIRVDGKKVPDVTLWEAWELYQVLTEMGHKPIITDKPDGGSVLMILF